jgi:hypothetical protein
VAAGSNHSLAVTTNGDVFACGNNQQGQIGLQGLEFSLYFSKVTSCESANVEKVFAGGDHSFLVLDGQFPKKKLDAQVNNELEKLTENFLDDIDRSDSPLAHEAD